MSKVKELLEEELKNVSGGDQSEDGEVKEESVTTNAYTGNLPNTLFVDCSFCNSKRQFIYDKWNKSSSFKLGCGCTLVKISGMSVKIIKHQD